MRTAILIYVLFLAASICFYHPKAAVELNSLIPVETLWVTKEKGMIRIAGDRVEGIGDSWKTAMRNVRESAEGIVFLETVDKIIISLEAVECLAEMRRDEALRPSVQLYLLSGRAMDSLDAYTAAHRSYATIENKEALPLIVECGGRYRLAEIEQRPA